MPLRLRFPKDTEEVSGLMGLKLGPYGCPRDALRVVQLSFRSTSIGSALLRHGAITAVAQSELISSASDGFTALNHLENCWRP